MFRSSLSWISVFAIGLLAGISCVEEDDCTPGSEGCPCSDGVCLVGLTCLSNYCVDPAWEPPGEAEEGAMPTGGGEAGGSADNVAACNSLVEAIECGDFDLSSALDCNIYADVACDVADYFDCLEDSFTCVDGAPDTSGFADCIDLAQCG